MSVEEFRNYNDDDYVRWVADHHRGYVLNSQRTSNPHDARLHLAHCETIRGTPAREDTFTGDWVKVCSESLRKLDSWVVRHTGSAVVRCGTCHPPGPALIQRVCSAGPALARGCTSYGVLGIGVVKSFQAGVMAGSGRRREVLDILRRSAEPLDDDLETRTRTHARHAVACGIRCSSLWAAIRAASYRERLTDPGRPRSSGQRDLTTGREFCYLARVDVSEVPEN